MRFGTTELVVILIVIIIIFGPSQIPKLTKMLGKSIKNFREGLKETEGVVEYEPKKENRNASDDCAEKKACKAADHNEEEK